MPESSHASVSARPRIHIEGEDKPELERDLTRLEIVETVQGLYRCEAEFNNWGAEPDPDFLYFDRKLLDFGKLFAVELDDDLLFEGRIMGLEARFAPGQTPRLSALVEDRFQDLRMTRRTRTFAEVSDADVAQRIASDHGLTADVSADGPNYTVLAQVNQSDLAFLRERARSIDAELWMGDSKLVMKTRDNRRASAIPLTLHSELESFTVLADLATQRSSVAANGWDVKSKEALQFSADESAIQPELNGDESGVSILKSKLGERKEALAHTVPLNSSETEAIARSYFKNCARRFVVGHGTARTRADLRVGAVVDLKKLGPLFSGKYYVVAVRHRFDLTEGLHTEFTAERAGLGRP